MQDLRIDYFGNSKEPKVIIQCNFFNEVIQNIRLHQLDDAEAYHNVTAIFRIKRKS